jgi:hypothetical protein
MASMTSAQKDQVIEQLQQQLQDAQSQTPELDNMAKRKLYAQNATVLYVTHVAQGKKHSGVDVCAKLSCNVGIKDGDDWREGGKWVDVTSTWFIAWDEVKTNNYVAADLLQTFQDIGPFRAKFYWQWNSNVKNIIQETYTDKHGEDQQKDAFKYTPDKKIFAFDHLPSKPSNRNSDIDDLGF